MHRKASKCLALSLEVNTAQLYWHRRGLRRNFTLPSAIHRVERHFNCVMRSKIWA